MTHINIFNEDYIFLSDNVILDKKTGEVTKLTEENIVSALTKYEANPESRAGDIKETIEIVKGVDVKTISFRLKDVEYISPVNGFLIEVYLSGTESPVGKLTKMYRNDVVDPITNQVLRAGFGAYFDIEVDKQ